MNNLVQITGNTYPVKDKLKNLGAKWDADNKCWRIHPSKLTDAMNIVNSQTPQVKGVCTKCGKPCNPQYPTCYDCKPAPSKCKQCGAAGSRYNKIYRNGICAQCYRDEQEERDMGY